MPALSRGVGTCWPMTSQLHTARMRLSLVSSLSVCAPCAGGGFHQLREAGQHVLPGLHAAAQRAHLQQEGHGTGSWLLVRPLLRMVALRPWFVIESASPTMYQQHVPYSPWHDHLTATDVCSPSLRRYCEACSAETQIENRYTYCCNIPNLCSGCHAWL